MEALGVSAKFFEDGRLWPLASALQPPCDCWTFGREAVVEHAKSVAESLKAPPLVDAWLDAIAADDTGKLPSIGFGVSAEDGACKLYVLNYGGHEPTLPLVDALPQTARKPDRASSVLVSVEWKFGEAKTQLRQYAVEAAEGDVSVARHTQDERFAGDELVAALDGAFGVKQSEDIAVTVPFQYDGDTTPPLVAAPLSKSGLKLKPQDGNIDANPDAKLAALLKDAAPGAGAWLEQSRVVRHALSNVQFGEGFVTLYRHPTVFGFVDPSSVPQHLALRNALTKRARRASRRRLSEKTPCDEAEISSWTEPSATQGSMFIQFGPQQWRGGSRLDVHTGLGQRGFGLHRREGEGRECGEVPELVPEGHRLPHRLVLGLRGRGRCLRRSNRHRRVSPARGPSD